ncbi:MAG TPA: hypothetical protein VGF67_20035 [Ktedonobacteraceae bacterium]|jgi:hypothetical protein
MIQAIIQAFGNALSTVFNAIPHLAGFLLIALVGWLVGMGVDKLVTGLLHKVGFDRLSQRVGLTRMEQRIGWKVQSSRILGRVAFWFIFLIFLIPAADALGVPTITSTLTLILNYLPNVFVAILALLLGAIVGSFAADVVRGSSRPLQAGQAHILGNVVRWAIIGFACLIALEQLQIAPALITILFAAVMAGLALAFGLSFGLGGREQARRLLSHSEGRWLAAQPYDPNQIVQQARSDLAHTERSAPPPYVAPPTAPGGTRPPTQPPVQGPLNPPQR